MGIATYLRVSSEEQRERQTILNQREYAERWFATNAVGEDGIEWYVDDGVSGMLPLAERPEGRRLVDDARAGRISTLYIYKVDRLGREPGQTLMDATTLATLGVELRSLTQSIDSSTSAGRFMLVMLCGVAGFERDTIVERSIEGSNRLARDGVWLGGIVPFGYEVVGKDREARLVVDTDPIPGLNVSEADVIRLIYRRAAEEGRSCPRIAEELNRLGIPTAYTRDDRSVQRGKRKVRTSGRWTAGRVRNLIVSTTYRGLHQYGKRSKKPRELIERQVPAIVSQDVWSRAQEALHRNQRFSRKNAKRSYLLRGLMRCGCCGLMYTGTAWIRANGREELYYTCNAKNQDRGLYGRQGKRCPSKAVSGEVEQIIWQDIDGFLRNPGAVLRQLQAELSGEGHDLTYRRQQAAAIERVLQGIQQEQDTVLGLFRRGRIDEQTLDRQLDQIEVEEAGLRDQLQKLTGQLEAAEDRATQLRSAEALLWQLQSRLDGNLDWDTKRQIVEALVAGIRIDTVGEGRDRVPTVHVTYRFTPTETRTGKGSSRRPG